MKNNCIRIITGTLAGIFAALAAVQAQEVINLRPNQVTPGGFYDIGRVRVNYSDITTSGFSQWSTTGTTGLKPTQGIFQAFARFHMSADSDGDGTTNFAEFQAMSRIYLNVPVLSTERAGLNPLGVVANMYLVPEINIPEGSMPNAGNASGWDTRPGNYRLHTFPADVDAPGKSGTTQPDAGTGTKYSIDITDVMKRWIDQGFVSASSVFGVGFVPAEPLINNNIALPQADRLTTFDLPGISFSSTPQGSVLGGGGAPGPAPGPARLINISTRGTIGAGQGILVPGFIVKDGTKQVLVRAVGSELSTFGITSPAANPRIRLMAGSTEMATNDDWDSTSAGKSAVAAANASTGAFALTDGSKSAALTFTAQANVAYTVLVDDPTSTTGVVIVEVYEVP